MHTISAILKGKGLILFIVIINIMMQIILMRAGLDNQITNKATVDYFDADGYVEKARLIAEKGDFYSAFQDGYRTPGYPVFLSLFYRNVKKPLLVARYFQIVCGSAIIILFYFSLIAVCGSHPAAVFGAILAALWPPAYYFAQMLYPESLSLVLVAAIIYFISQRDKRPSLSIIALSLCLVGLVYLKPNHLLMGVPVFLVIWFSGSKWKGRLLDAALLTSIVIVLIFPWTVWVSSVNGTFITLSTAQGLNAYLGTGIAGIGGENPEKPSIAAKVMKQIDIQQIPYGQPEDRKNGKVRISDQNKHLQKKAGEIWLRNPLQTGVFGVSKILHSFGFSFRNLRDYIVIFQFFVSVLSIWYLWRIDRHRLWCLFFMGITGVTALQAFAFLPAQRFKTVLFDLPALFIIALGLIEFYQRQSWFQPEFSIKNI